MKKKALVAALALCCAFVVTTAENKEKVGNSNERESQLCCATVLSVLLLSKPFGGNPVASSEIPTLECTICMYMRASTDTDDAVSRCP